MKQIRKWYATKKHKPVQRGAYPCTSVFPIYRVTIVPYTKARFGTQGYVLCPKPGRGTNDMWNLTKRQVLENLSLGRSMERPFTPSPRWNFHEATAKIQQLNKNNNSLNQTLLVANKIYNYSWFAWRFDAHKNHFIIFFSQKYVASKKKGLCYEIIAIIIFA